MKWHTFAAHTDSNLKHYEVIWFNSCLKYDWLGLNPILHKKCHVIACSTNWNDYVPLFSVTRSITKVYKIIGINILSDPIELSKKVKRRRATHTMTSAPKHPQKTQRSLPKIATALQKPPKVVTAPPKIATVRPKIGAVQGKLPLLVVHYRKFNSFLWWNCTLY